MALSGPTSSPCPSSTPASPPSAQSPTPQNVTQLPNNLIPTIDEEAAGYFRAILKTGEISERALELTVDILRYNPGDYHAWALRRQIYDKLELPLK